MPIPSYPEFAPIDLTMHDELYPALNLLPDGISEFCFSNLYLFRKTYNYELSRAGEALIVRGVKNGLSFFYAPCKLPEPAIYAELLQKLDYHKHLSPTQYELHKDELLSAGYSIVEDRDNFDYLYSREELAQLSGKSFHKKKNLVNAFNREYPISTSAKLTAENSDDARFVLEQWHSKHGDGDRIAALEALEHFAKLGMRGRVYYVEEKPVAWCMGEALAKGRMFTIHFEKAIDEYKGVYQFVNNSFAQSLPRYFHVINREQDLGDEGMRQAKMTYRPTGFVVKYKVLKNNN